MFFALTRSGRVKENCLCVYCMSRSMPKRKGDASSSSKVYSHKSSAKEWRWIRFLMQSCAIDDVGEGYSYSKTIDKQRPTFRFDSGTNNIQGIIPTRTLGNRLVTPAPG